jgi:hypothetical protein
MTMQNEEKQEKHIKPLHQNCFSKIRENRKSTWNPECATANDKVCKCLDPRVQWTYWGGNSRTGAPSILQYLSRHVANTFLRFSTDPSSESKSRESVNPIAVCVAAFNRDPSSRIWKRQNFFAISSWREPIGSNLLNSHSRVWLSQAQAPVSENPLVLLVDDLQFQLPVLIDHQWPEHNHSE